MSFAVIKTGGKQYIVHPGDKIKIEKLDASEGKEVEFCDVLLVSDKELHIGTPYVKGYKIKGKVLGQGKGEKIIVYKYKPKKRYHKKQGHRQLYTEVEILSIGTGMGRSKAVAKITKPKVSKKKVSATSKKAEVGKKKVAAKATPKKK